MVQLVLLAGCQPPRPWQGVSAIQVGKLQEHRLLGIALVENGQPSAAQAEFEAIRKAQPALAFGHVNSAVALLQQTGKAAAAVVAAAQGAKVRASSAWPRVVLAQALRSVTPPQPERATAELEAAVRLAPATPRVLGALVRHLEAQPGDQSARLYDLRRRLAEAAAGNLVAQAQWARALAERGEHAEAAAVIERLPPLLPKLPPESVEPLARARKELAAGTPAAPSAVQIVINTLRSSPQYSLANNALFGSDSDPADLLLREWDTPPPPLPEPRPEGTRPPAEIRWTDVTTPAGLAAATARGTAPAAVGDVDLWPGAGKITGASQARTQDRPDLVVGASPGGLLLNGGAAFTGAAAAGPASPLLADLNNDFALDLYVAAPGGDRVWANGRRGEPTESGLRFRDPGPQPFQPAPAAPPARGPGAPLAVDVDQDGDLDILRPSGDPSQPALRYLRNNGNLTFTDLTVPAGLALSSLGARQAAFGDFDADGDPDLFLVRSEGPCQLFLNRRQDRFRNATTGWGVGAAAGAQAACVADFDRDGRWDVAVAGRAPHGTLLYHNTGSHFEADTAALSPLAAREASWIAALDYDNDTWIDLVTAGPQGLMLLRNERGRFVEGGAPIREPCTWVTPVDYDQDGDLDLLAATAAGRLRLLRNEGGNARPWLKVELQGLIGVRDQATNSYAVGAEVQPLTVYDQQKLLVTGPQLHVGLGRADRALALRVTWTNGVPDNAVAPKTAEAVHYVQTARGSCPFLYGWDGERWRFVADCNWRSPIGMLSARGRPVPHDQTADWARVRGELLRPVEGFYRMIVTEELREVSYFDQLRLAAVDHSADTEVYADERFHFGPPAPYRLYTARERRLPAAARDGEGRDLLPALRAVDNVFTPVPDGPYRGVRAPHDLVLDLGDVPDLDRVILFLHGWIYPASCSGNVGAAQNPELHVVPPTLYAGDGKGGWTEIDRGVGMPCGKRKTVVLDLSGRLRRGDARVKLTTTMEIRWDAAFFTSGEAPAPVRQTLLPLSEADLRERGCGTRYREVPDGPDLFDYQRPLSPDRTPAWPPIAGSYTRLGDCAPLLETVDDRSVLMAPGDELRLAFDGRRLPPLPAGWKRDFIFFTDGWTKDTDRNTVTGETVMPLPFHGMKRYPYGPEERFPDMEAHRRWQQEWNTRVK